MVVRPMNLILMVIYYSLVQTYNCTANPYYSILTLNLIAPVEHGSLSQNIVFCVRNPKQPPVGCINPVVNNGNSTISTGEFTGFLNHQQYSSWWFQRIFIFYPTWRNDPISRAYFSNGLKPPPPTSIFGVFSQEVKKRRDFS